MTGIFLSAILTLMEKYSKHIEPEQSLETHEHVPRLFQEIERITKLANRLDINVQVLIRYGDDTKEIFPDHTLFAASLAKLPLAYMVLDKYYAQDILDIKPEQIAKNGNGKFDMVCEASQVTAKALLEDMLMFSGNTAFNVFSSALGGADQINSFYKELGWVKTTVKPTKEGGVEIGTTTPREAMDQLEGLLDMSDENPLVETVQNALLDYAITRYGIRQRVLPSKNLTIYNKTGEYNGDHDVHNPVPYSVRHDVGLIQGGKGQILYALLTSTTKNKFRTKIASELLGQFGAEFANAVGESSTKWMGSLAVRAKN
jgi:beta-lactamase class A